MHAGTRTNFTDAQKAKIYVRDRATCCFSGVNLWLLDGPLRPGYERDWVDHVKPTARGGAAVEDNGVCASAIFNAKKRANSADNIYLFEYGLPTSDYFDLFGPLPPAMAARLERLSRLTVADWYFNRAIGLVLLSFNYRCFKWDDKRDDRYWLRAAYKKLETYRSKATGASLEERGIISLPSAAADLWLSLRQVESESGLRTAVKPLFKIYRANCSAWARYFYDSETDAQRERALHRAEAAEGLTDDVLECIRADFDLRTKGSRSSE